MSTLGVRISWRRLVAAAGTAVLVAGCGATVSHRPAVRIVKGGTVAFALPAGATPNYIFPITPGAQFSTVNLGYFQPLMFRPLYWLGKKNAPVVSPTLSLADAPVYSNGGRTVTITLKPYRWSNGTPVTSRDVQFFMNLLTANKANWGGYVQGEMPDSIVSFTIDSARTFSITFNKVFSPNWLLDNQLSSIVPLPLAWDKTSASTPPGNFDLTTKGAAAVYKFLNAQSSTLATYATNPLWQVVDGPFRLAGFDPSTGYASFVPNRQYSGSVKPHIAKLEEVPFIGNAAEFNQLRSGQLDYGYLPTTDVTQRTYFASRGYSVRPWPGWSINYLVLNYTNRQERAFFDQLYLRQVMQLTVNQPQWVADTLKGYGSPDYGPVPLQPKSPFLSTYEAGNPYPYSPSRAAALLRQHGWTVKPNGASVCSRPGTGPSECGAGIRGGAPLVFNVLYQSGGNAVTQQMEAWKSNATQVGLELNLSERPFNTVITIANPCTTGPTCTWDIAGWGGWGFGTPDPTGDQAFSPLNTGGYQDPTMNRLIAATTTAGGQQPMFTYENYLAKNLPVLWWPNPSTQISVISSKLHGVYQNPLGLITPEYWYLTR